MKYKVKKFIRKNPLAAVGIVIWFVFILCAIFAPLLAPYDPAVQDLSIRNNAPSAAHWFGTDSLGRDVLSRVIYGSRISIPSGILVVILACAFGGLYGAVAGYFGKAVDEILMRFADMVMSFPAILLAMSLAAALGTSVMNAILAIAVVAWPKYARLMRGMVLSVRETEYVTSERSIGQRRWTILVKTIIPNCMSSLIVLASTDVGTAILTFAGLSFLGMGVVPPTAEWGYMVSDGVSILKYWWISFFPGASIFLFPQIDELITYPDCDIYGEAFDKEVSAQGLDGKCLGVTRDISSMLTLCLLNRHHAKVKDISAEMDAMRAVKDADEIELMRYASRVADKIYYDILPMLKPGTPIREIEHEIERLLETYDCSYTSFPAEVLNYGPKAGNRIGEPYGILAEDHTIAFDYGVVYKGYCSDFGRTVFLREPSPELRRCHELVMKAQQTALDAAVIGTSKCSELNAACHAVMEEAGMGEYFIHRMGHGIGKDVHERPFMAEGEDTVVQPGMCFTDEPSLFLPGKGLVRVEDVVLVKPDGFEYLNQVTKDIVVLG